MSSRWLIGLAPGCSVDGVDAALVEVDGVGLELKVRKVFGHYRPYEPDLQNMLVQAGSATGHADVRQLSMLHRVLGETMAVTARQTADRARFNLQQVQCIGCPGHTIWRQPDGRFPSELKLGMAAVVAERTGLTTVSDFRTRDIAAGGLGSPLESLADYLMFRDVREDRALLHLGGTAVVVYLPAGSAVRNIVAFEAGPCNTLLGSLMRQVTGGKETYDPGGKHAVQGRCIEEALDHWLEHPFWQRRPPRSLSSREFGDEFALQAMTEAKKNNWGLHDLLCTATHLIACGIAYAIRRFLPDGRLPGRILLSGGGVRNGLLWNLLEQQLSGVTLDRTDSAGIPAVSRTAVANALLAALTLDGVPANLPTATGAGNARLLGSITPGSGANWSRCLAWMAGQGTLRN